ncbi:NUDIX hydrolase [Bacteroidota bacterium]
MNKEDLNKLIKNLPDKPGILGKDEFFNSSVLIPLVKYKNEYNFLFEKRAKNIRQGGEICFPGGEHNPAIDKDFEDTAIRETTEEIGVWHDRIKIVGSLDTIIGPRGVTVDSCIGILSIRNINECTIDRSEVEKIFTVPVSYFETNKPKKYKVISKNIHTFYNDEGIEEDLIPSGKNAMDEHIDKSYREFIRTVLVYKTHGEIIWGITARLIFEVILKLTMNNKKLVRDKSN